MASMSQITIVGNLGRDPETKYTQSGKMNVAMSVAVNKYSRDSYGGNSQKTTWFRVTCWGRTAESMDKLAQQGALVKGVQVIVMGDLDIRDYEVNGEKRTSNDISVDRILLVGQPANTGHGGQQGGTTSYEEDPF